MENQRLNELIEKYILKTATVTEQYELLEWYNRENEKDTVWPIDVTEEEQLVKQRMLSKISRTRMVKPLKRHKLWPSIAAAAAILLTIGSGLWFFTFQKADKEIAQINGRFKNDMTPGKNTATLTLANGKIIKLSDAKNGVIIDAAKLSYNDGSLIPIGGSGHVGGVVQMLTATTPRGGQYQVHLPDGTKVWLNAASVLKFPSSFTGESSRNVDLIGEAYFEVCKDAKHPFVVKTARQEVTVLGTHFNINSYKDEEDIKTTLLEGSVRVGTRPPGRIKSRILVPGQESIVNSNFELSVQEVYDLEQAVAWKNGKFVFSNQDIVTVMRQISRWYDAEIIYQQTPSTTLMGGMISRNKNVSEVLLLLEATGVGHFKIEGRKIIVTR
jgi:transmembrane sensor